MAGDDTGDDARARGSRTYRDAYRTAAIDGALWALGRSTADVLAELVRRHGVAAVARGVADRPEYLAAFEIARVAAEAVSGE